ncbi:hypothetical protein, partial [Mesotoga sp.]|uniref:hypothetical protein n=1 Tax=Mesotoga sp. TaxID=2053577 RepID=UPI00345E1C2F
MTDAVGTGLAEGETGQAEPDWPALADGLPNVHKVINSRKRNRFQPRPPGGERPFAPTRELHNHLKL